MAPTSKSSPRKTNERVEPDLGQLAKSAERAASRMSAGKCDDQTSSIIEAANKVGAAWSGGWLGYHSRVYTHDLEPKRPGQHFDLEFGSLAAYSNRTSGNWAEHSFDIVVEHILENAGKPDLDLLAVEASKTGEIFDSVKSSLEPIVAAAAESGESYPRELKEKLTKLTSHLAAGDYVRAVRGDLQFVTRDTRAVNEGVQVPPHISVLARAMELRSYGHQLKELAKIARMLDGYLRTKRLGRGGRVMKTGIVFVGHGRSATWRDLKDLLTERLGLRCVEFNSTSAAGLTTVQRLQDMLDESEFAFLVLTAEDIHHDGSAHARENVIHEVGLFQGRLGFEKAIVLLEDGCEEFSNIRGLVQIRFPAGNLRAKAEEIRAVLEREGVIASAAASST